LRAGARGSSSIWQPDGKRFAVVHPEATEQKGPTRVTFLLNFFAELRHRASVGK
jgi:hypothetical protein